MAVTLRPEWTDRTVNQSPNKHCVIAGTPLSLNKAAAAYLSGCIKFFFVVDTKWEVVHAADGFGANHGSAKDYGVAVARQNASAGTKAYTANFQTERLAAKIGLYF